MRRIRIPSFRDRRLDEVERAIVAPGRLPDEDSRLAHLIKAHDHHAELPASYFKRGVTAFEDGVEVDHWPTLDDAAAELGMPPEAIAALCDGPAPRRGRCYRWENGTSREIRVRAARVAARRAVGSAGVPAAKAG